MKTLIAKYKLELLGITAGMVAGFSYWYFVGCASGTCPITSSPIISSLYGGMMGWLIFSSLKKSKTEKSNH
ncbi:MAG: DUF6132 family protein [Bacteroidota bacterium]